MPKKLIEVALPLEAINKASAREKSIRHGHPSTLHVWWARRPLAACRAVLFGQLVDDPSDPAVAKDFDFQTCPRCEARQPSEAVTAADLTSRCIGCERERLHQVIRDMVEWPASTPAARATWERALDAARYEIARSVARGTGKDDEPNPPAPPKGDREAVLRYLAAHAPPVYDPFCGGGSIPLEAQRLGLRAYGSDLNPVAVLISKALVEIPPKFAGLPPVHPDAKADLGGRQWRGAEGLAEDVRRYGQWMRDEAKKRIGHLYPDATLPDGRKATVIAWLWARTVRSPDPAAKGSLVPLASSFLLSSKAGKEVIVKIVIDPEAEQGWRFEVKQSDISAAEVAHAKMGTKIAKGGSFSCVLTGAPISRAYIQAEGKADRIHSRLMAIICKGEGRRFVLTPSTSDVQKLGQIEAATVASARTGFLSGSTPTRAMITGGVCSAYGLRTWGHLYLDRQIVTLAAFADLAREVGVRVVADARAKSMEADDGDYASYAAAISTFLALNTSKLSAFITTQARWRSKDFKSAPGFARQSLPMVWDFADLNPFAGAGGDWHEMVAATAKLIELNGSTVAGGITQIDAPQNHYSDEPIIINTDPPYYDNMGYAYLSDYFYVWLKRSISELYPDLFRRLETPKQAELVATPYDHGGTQEAADEHFRRGMERALVAMRLASVPDSVLIIYYAFKQSKADGDGNVSSSGWSSFLQSMLSSDLFVDGAWPVQTEMNTRLVAAESNALGSSIVHVCRSAPHKGRTVSRRDFVQALRRELPDALAKMRAAGIHPVDIPQAALGPGMACFSRYAAVREADDSPMPVAKAIALINQVREEIAHEDSSGLDAATRFALVWFENFGWNQRDSGQAINVALGYGLALGDLERVGVVRTERGQARLTKREEMAADWRPFTDRTLTTWELAQALNRALNDGGGVQPAGRLLAEARDRAADARWLADRLFGLSETRKLSEEARGWGRLTEAWTAIEAAAETADAAAPMRAEQLTLDLPNSRPTRASA